MIAAHVSRRYARALLEIGSEGGDLDVLVDELSRAAKAYEDSTDLRGACENPIFPLTVKKAVLREVGQKLSLGPAALNTMLLLTDRRRLRLLPEIAQFLREMNDAKKGTVRAEVTTAVALSEAFYSKLKEQLERVTGKRVVLDRKQDPAILGGVIARIGDQVYDSSIRTRLASLKTALLPN
ncbi:ATP synthase F1 subunit delta [soil metagenome]